MREQLVSEPIQPTTQRVDSTALARGEPSLPFEFKWRDRTYSIAEVLGKWKTTGPCRSGGDEKYVRKHWWKVRTVSGEVMKLYFDRQPKKATEMKWYLYSMVPPPEE